MLELFSRDQVVAYTCGALRDKHKKAKPGKPDTILCVFPYPGQVLELEHPVKDAVGYVYEKASILNYLQGHPNGRKHPVAGRRWGGGAEDC